MGCSLRAFRIRTTRWLCAHHPDADHEAVPHHVQRVSHDYFTLFVIAASLLLARFMQDTEPKDVLGITAAYAAVLVVFVGTSTTESGLSNAKVAIVMGTVVAVLGLVIGISAAQLARRRFWYKVFNFASGVRPLAR